MTFAVTAVGTGTAFPEATRGPTCSLIEFDQHRIVVDLGSGSLQKLAALGVTPLNLDALLLTHAHLDHLADALPLLFALGVPGYDRHVPLPIYLSHETRRILGALDEALGGWLSASESQVEFRVLDREDSARTCGLDVRCAPMNHHASSIGFRFDSGDRVLAIPGDTGPCSHVVELCERADLAILECSMRDEDALPTHLTPSQIADIVNAAHIKEVALVHRYPSAKRVDAVAELTNRTSARVSIPDDGTRFVLTGG